MESRRGTLIMYQLITNENGTVNAILRTADVACIPINELNTDYLKYLDWLAEGNEPLPAN